MKPTSPDAPQPMLPDESNDPLIGTVVGGRFHVIRALRQAGPCRIYHGEHRLGAKARSVAVKMLVGSTADDPLAAACLMRECGILSELEHPGTAKAYDFGQTPSGHLYLVTELPEGISLRTAIEAGPLGRARGLRILSQLCAALHEAHEKGIVHGNLDPAIVYLGPRAGDADHVKLFDIGLLGRAVDHYLPAAAVPATPYTSPERIRGDAVDGRSDIYSLGVIAYEMLTGRLPFEADTAEAWARQHLTAAPRPLDAGAGADIPERMKGAVMRALQKDPAERPSSAMAWSEELAGS